MGFDEDHMGVDEEQLEQDRIQREEEAEEKDEDVDDIYMLLKPFTKMQLHDLSTHAIKEHPDDADKLCRMVARRGTRPPVDPEIYQKEFQHEDPKEMERVDWREGPLDELLESFRAWKLEQFVRSCVNRLPEFADYVIKEAGCSPAHRTILVRSHGFGWDATPESLSSEYGDDVETIYCASYNDVVTDDDKHSPPKINCCASILFKRWSSACNALRQQPVVRKIGNRTTVCTLAPSGVHVCRCLYNNPAGFPQQSVQVPSHDTFLSWLCSAPPKLPVRVQVTADSCLWEHFLHGSLDHYFLQMDRVGKMEEKPDAIMNAVVSHNSLVDPTVSKQFEYPVCKSSSQLLENPPALSTHHNNSTHTSLLLNHRDLLCLLSGEKLETRTRVDFPPPLFPMSTAFRIMGSSSVNGILGLWFPQNRAAVLWNPFTKEIKIVPPSLVEFESPYRKPDIEYYGFGYDGVEDDYKVLRYVDFSESDNWAYCMENVSLEPLWEIYSLKSDSWKKLGCEMPPGFLDCNYARFFGCFGLCIGGVCHWLGEMNKSLVSFNLSTEDFLKTATPSYVWCDELWCDEGERLLAEINGHVALISSYEAETKTTTEVSILHKLGEEGSWTKLFIIASLPCVVNRLMGAGKEGDIFFYDDDDGVAWFDVSTCQIVHLGLKRYCQIVTYKENLESLISRGFEKYDDEDIVNVGQPGKITKVYEYERGKCRKVQKEDSAPML